MKNLDNPVYIGKIVYGKTVTKKVRGKRDEYHRVETDDYLLADGKHEAIIDEETWNAVRQKRNDAGIKWVKTYSMEHEHILSGIVKCPYCGIGMSGMVYRYKNRKTGEVQDIFYYRCRHRKHSEDGRKCNFKTTFRQDKLNAEVEQIVLDMVRDKNFYAFIVSNLEAGRENLREQLRQVEEAKNKPTEQMDRLDVTDRHYDRKYQDMQNRLDSLYDLISDLEGSIASVSGKMSGANDEKITAENLCKILKNFDKLYSKISDFDKKLFYQSFIKSIEIDPDAKSDGRIVKHIDLNFRSVSMMKMAKICCSNKTTSRI